jgi:serine/threonine-protein kinase
MNPERWKKIDQLLDSLLELEQDRRAEYIDRACGDDSALRSEIESLLAAHSRSVGFIDTLRVGAAAEFFGRSESEELVGRSISHYRVLSSLGAGGMGEVYLASRNLRHLRRDARQSRRRMVASEAAGSECEQRHC